MPMTAEPVVWKPLSLSDTNLIRGLSMLIIMLHNYFHLIPPAPGENEFDFSRQRWEDFWRAATGAPADVPHLLFAFLGAYSLQAFIFLSAYGLAKTWRETRWAAFVAGRFAKLYPAFLGAAVLLVALHFFMRSPELVSSEFWRSLALKLLLVANLVPDQAFAVVGPWWFYGFIFQFYLIFPFLMRLDVRTRGRSTVVLFFVGLAVSALGMAPWENALSGTKLHAQALGHLPEFCLGIFLARRGTLRLPRWLLPLSLAGVVAGNFIGWLWPFTLAFAALAWIGFIPGFLAFCRRHALLQWAFVGLGELSMYLFATHGFLRAPFLDVARRVDHALLTALVAVLFVAFSAGVADGFRHALARVVQAWDVVRRMRAHGSNDEENESPKARTLGSLR